MGGAELVSRSYILKILEGRKEPLSGRRIFSLMKKYIKYRPINMYYDIQMPLNQLEREGVVQKTGRLIEDGAVIPTGYTNGGIPKITKRQRNDPGDFQNNYYIMIKEQSE